MLFGQPLPAGLASPGLPNSMMKERYELNQNASARVSVRDADFRTSTRWLDVYVESLPVTGKLDTSELALPVSAQITAYCVADATPCFKYPTMDHYARTPWPDRLDDAAYACVGFASIKRPVDALQSR